MDSPSSMSGAAAPARAVLPQATAPRTPTQTHTPAAVAQSDGYGLPCARCRTYYLASLKACPVCKSNERVSPKLSLESVKASSEAPNSEVEAERQRILRQIKTDAYASHLQIQTAESFRCSKEENHAGGFEAASVCQSCYDQLQGRADLMEAALHMDLNDATKLIYEAVWADTSDPAKTYQNAAQALLVELHRRAGISAVLGPHKPRSH